MARGGYHEHAERWGRKPGWKTEGKTRTIRVPEALAEQILELAHKLDEEQFIGSDTKAKGEELEDFKDGLYRIADSILKNREVVRSRDAAAVKRAFQELLEQI